jgi:hypothetical protein
MRKRKSSVSKKKTLENVRRAEQQRYYLKIKQTKRAEYLKKTYDKCRAAKHQFYQEGKAKRARTGNETAKTTRTGNETAKTARTGNETASSPDHQGASDFSIPVEISSCVDNAKSIDQRTAVLSDELGGQSAGFHRALVCIVCDRFIIGMEPVFGITSEKLRKHTHRIGVASYNEYYGTTLKSELVRQYSVEGLSGLLLSPRARCRGDQYDICNACNGAMNKQSRKRDSPPKHVIANGFVIGSIPRDISFTNAKGVHESACILTMT